jgi:ABC-2 type transport system permease protein
MFIAAVVKEFKLVFRDMHALLVLFGMPAAFIIIMSLALQNQFSGGDNVTQRIYYSVESNSPAAEKFIAILNDAEYYQFVETPPINNNDILTVIGEDSQALLVIPSQFDTLFDPSSDSVQSINLWVSPSIDPRNHLLLESLLRAALIETMLSFLQSEEVDDVTNSVDLIAKDSIQSKYLLNQATLYSKPTAVQQNVPAWLIFSMFFVVIPISTTLIAERQQGTLTRLRTMNISLFLFLMAKALPYLLINQLQLVIMLLLGVFLVPLLGGDSLSLGSNIGALMLLSLAVGISAIGYALLVAVIAKTTAQATSLGGVGNILLGAIGGIMVPKFFMPEYMQELTVISPMSWGLDGFLEVLLYGNGVLAILDELLMLVAFGGIMLLLALLIFNKNALSK